MFRVVWRGFVVICEFNYFGTFGQLGFCHFRKNHHISDRGCILLSLFSGQWLQIYIYVWGMLFCLLFLHWILDHRFKQKSTSSMTQVQNSESDKNISVNVFSFFLKALWLILTAFSFENCELSRFQRLWFSLQFWALFKFWVQRHWICYAIIAKLMTFCCPVLWLINLLCSRCLWECRQRILYGHG